MNNVVNNSGISCLFGTKAKFNFAAGYDHPDKKASFQPFISCFKHEQTLLKNEYHVKNQ